MSKTRAHIVLTDEQVLHMRREIARMGELRIREWGRKYGVSHVTALAAVRGKTFKYLPDAVTTVFGPKSGQGRNSTVCMDDLKTLYKLRKDDPLVWTYAKLAEKASVLSGREIYATNVKRLLEKNFEEVKRPTCKAAPRQKVERAKSVPAIRSKSSSSADRRNIPVVRAAVIVPRSVPVGALDIASPAGRQDIAARLLAMRR